MSVDNIDIAELLELALEITEADNFRELSSEEHRILFIARAVVRLGGKAARAWGGRSGNITASLLSGLPLDDIAKWLAGFRSIAIKIEKADIEIGAGVNVEVDLDS